MVPSSCHMGPPYCESVLNSIKNHQKHNNFFDCWMKWKLEEHQTFFPRLFLKWASVLKWLTWGYWSHIAGFLPNEVITFQTLIFCILLQMPVWEIALCCFNVRHSERSLKRPLNGPIKLKMLFSHCPLVFLSERCHLQFTKHNVTKNILLFLHPDI